MRFRHLRHIFLFYQLELLIVMFNSRMSNESARRENERTDMASHF